ncbi:MAG: GNAT family N-acetyltransferase [Thermomicrobiales bacterium]|nr:GNAT family N-acetyltransferase [Thermomicrobiales bacterium]
MTTHLDAPSFLTGPTLYLRGIDRDDAKTKFAWHPSPFPTPSDLAAEQLEEEIPKNATQSDYRLIACRRSDDSPVGSFQFASEDQRSCWTTVHAHPLQPDAAAIRTEILEIAVPWLLHEREMMVVWLEAPAGEPGVATATAKLGMRFAYRFREAAWRAGAHDDLVCYEALHPVWVERLGRPKAAEEGPVERETRAPAPPPWTGEVPPGAFAVGERLYLRPIEQEDGEEMARWSARETEPFHDTGRHIGSPISTWQWLRSNTEGDPPGEIRFAIVAKEGDVVIGSVGIRTIDWVARSAETVMWIDRPEYRGAGYGTEAKHLILEYAFDRLGLHMVYSYAWEFNTRSCDAMRKQGYRPAGRMAWTGIKHAEFIDDLTFDLLASEWRASRKLQASSF